MSFQSEKSWEGFWRNTGESAAYRDGAPQEEVLNLFWSRFFSQALPESAAVQMLDIACGNGLVCAMALRTMHDKQLPRSRIFGLDLSLSALRSLASRSPQVKCVLADAALPPFQAGTFHLVVSQFGLEYAGLAAFGNVGVLLREGGVFAAVVHLKQGAIYNECRTNHEAVLGLEEAGFFEHSIAVFGTVSPASEGRKIRERFLGALAGVDAIIHKHGPAAAGGAIHRLKSDVLRMYQNRSAFSGDEVINWVSGMQKELSAYAGRMSAMMKAALDESDIEALKPMFVSTGMNLEVCETLSVGPAGEKAAWVLVAKRAGDPK